MLRENRINIHDLSHDEFEEVVTALCFSSPEVSPIYECVKVFARLNEEGTLTYARHPHDLGTSVVTSHDISSRLKEPAIASIVGEALSGVETTLLHMWPFSPGSSTWLQLEILHPEIQFKAPQNNPTIVIRRACRLRIRGNKVNCESTPVIERVFGRFKLVHPIKIGEWSVVCDPKVRLKNISGTGFLTECIEKASVSTVKEAAADITKNLMLENGLLEASPGFFFTLGDKQYRVASFKYLKPSSNEVGRLTERLAIPIAGWLK